MKVRKLLYILMLIGTMLTSTSCKGDHDKDYIGLLLWAYNINYTEEGYWDKCYDNIPFGVNGIELSHTATADEWDGVVYKAWKGFCPTVSTDNAEYPASERYLHQWASITGGGIIGQGAPCLLAFWDVNEPTNRIVTKDEASLCISTNFSATFKPVSLFITNSAYAYWSMKLGSDYNKPADASSLTSVHIHGVRNGRETGVVTVDLQQGTNLLDDWTYVKLTSLGEVDYIYFQMTSTDTGIWGMNVPAYFCVDNLVITE